jgi:hypothetical protein
VSDPAQVVAVLFAVDAFIWLIGTLPTLFYALRNHSLPTMAGIRLLSGPFESLGIDVMIVCGMIFVVISGLKILAAYWLWHSMMEGAVLSLILLGLSGIFWYGFALPFGPVMGLAELVFLVLAWGSLN